MSESGLNRLHVNPVGKQLRRLRVAKLMELQIGESMVLRGVSSVCD